MKVSDLHFDFPEDLIALKPEASSRVMFVDRDGPREIDKSGLLHQLGRGDVLVVNDARVDPRRIVIGDFDILFLKPRGPLEWEALFQLRKLEGTRFDLPGGVFAELIKKGRPHLIRVSRPLGDNYFEEHGEPPLPPYIYRARGSNTARAEDREWYQTAWARAGGSVAAPTASFHLSNQDLEWLREQGVFVETVTLHVGAGTFLPVTVEDLDEHVMHKEWVSIPKATWERVQSARAAGRRVWVLGTTATRALESAAHGLLAEPGRAAPSGTVVDTRSLAFLGETNLLIQPGFEFRVTDRLLTNFHQPESTLLALVCAFAGRDRVMAAYQWAIERRFRLFSYGDLSVWIP